MTRIANSEIIESAKKDMLEKIKTALNLQQIKQILEDQHNLEISDDIEVNSGDVIIHNNRLAFKMEFEVLLSLSVLLDNEGNYIPQDDSPEENIDEFGTQAEDIVKGL